MSTMEWMIVADIGPPDAKASEEELRWLKLADDALHNRETHSDDGYQLNPGSRAAQDFEKDTHDLQLALRKLQRESKSIFR